MLKKGDRLVVGVSGGADSMALLLLLLALKKKHSLELIVAHMNHGLNRLDNDKHQRFVEQYCQLKHIPFFSKKIALKKIATQSKRSIEEAGRDERYTFFSEVAKKAHAKKIATAHTLDDQAETVLFRLLRGAGLKGLSGISAKRREGSYEIIRPLIGLEKNDLIQYLKEEKQLFCTDKSNRDTIYTRNRIRLELLPKLARDYNPQVKFTLANLQRICEDATQYMEPIAQKCFKRCLLRSQRPKVVLLKLKNLMRLHPALQREVLQLAWKKKNNSHNSLSSSHLDNIIKLLLAKEADLECHLPQGVLVKKRKLALEFI